MSGSEDDFYAESLPHPAFTSFHCLYCDTLWAFELAMQLASLPRAKSPMVNFSQHFDQVKVSALNDVCFSKKLSRWRQCTAPILNDELGLGPRVTLPESLLCDAAGSVWVWLSPNNAIISFNLSVMRLRLKDIEWLCPIHQIKRDRWTRLMKASSQDQACLSYTLFDFLSSRLVLHSLGLGAISILAWFFTEGAHMCTSSEKFCGFWWVTDKGRVRLSS